MDKLNFSSFAKIIKKGVPKSTMIDITNLLLNSITDHESVLNTKGEPYVINNYYTHQWWHQLDDIPTPIKEAAASAKIMSIATAYFENEVIPKLSPQKEIDTYSNLKDLIKYDRDISDDTRNELSSHYDNNNLTEFLKETFLYAVQKINKLPKPSKNPNDNISNIMTEDINELNKLLQRFPKPIPLVPPEDLKDHEMLYISELLAAYSEHNNVDIITQNNITNYPKLKKNFDRQRKDYYAAETIRQSVRDTFAFCDINEFNVLKEESYDGIIDVCEDEYPDGFTRLKEVMRHVTLIQLNKSILLRLPRWIGSSERKGICHMLVNDEQIKWVNQDE